MTEHATEHGPLVYSEAEIHRVFRGPKGRIREWMEQGLIPTRWLPDGRPVVLHDELLEMLRGLPREPRAGG